MDKYFLVKEKYHVGVCLACTAQLESSAFCLCCKAPRPLDWTTGHNSLDSFIMKSWSNAEKKTDAYIQWVEYSQLTNIQEMILQHRCTHKADWIEPTTDKLVKVIFKTIVDGQNSQSFNFYQVNFPLKCCHIFDM